MLNSLDTRIAFFGGACSTAALETVVRLAAAGFHVVAGTRDPRESTVFDHAEIPIMPSREEAVKGAQVIITSCAHPEDVEDLYMGDNGLLDLAEPDAFLIDLSMTTPRMAQEIQAMAAVNELNFLDAPVINVGEKEESVCFMGGEPEAVEMASALMPYLAATVHPLHSPGEGQLSAAMVIIALAGGLMGTIEAMAIAHICGFNSGSALDALASTSAASRALIDYVPQVINYDFEGRITVSEFLDMLDTALLVAEDLDVTLPMTETAYQLCDLLRVVGGESMNIQALALLYEDEKTCADYGLDWALADEVHDNRFGQQGDYGDYGDDPLAQNMRDWFSSMQTQLNATGTMGTGDNGLDDYRNHHKRVAGDDTDYGFPPAGDFFSRN